MDSTDNGVGPSEPAGIVLIGLPGSGKSSVGAALAQRLSLEFIDTDDVIEAHLQMKVSEIFAQLGEDRFRQLERETLEELVKSRRGQRLVLSVGGGLPVPDHNRLLLHQIGRLVYLKASLSELVNRLKSDQSRPLLNPGGRSRTATTDEPPDGERALHERLQSLLDRRSQAYEEADIIIETSGLTIQEVAARVEKALNTYSPNVK